MKRCPECRRDYYDDSLSYCLDDGTALLEGPSSVDDPATVILPLEAEPPTILGDSTERQSLSAHRAAQPHETGTLAEQQGVERRPAGLKNRVLQFVALLCFGVLIAGGFFGYRYYASTNAGEIRSIAVLPFQNRNSDADTEYLSDGLAESLIYRLSQIPDLKVSPRSSVFRYKGQDADAEKVGSELGVDAVMSGRLIQRGENLTISVDLVDVRNKRTLWGEQFERKISDLLTTQREIASAITEKLQLKLSGGETKGITKQYTNDNEAYQLYLKGRYYWNRRTAESLKKSIELLTAATEKDPNFALAYAGLADAYVVASTYTGERAIETMPKAKLYAMKSIELDPTLAEPHAALGLATWFNDWDKPGAEKEFQRAIELNPNYPTAHHWYSRHLRSLGRSDEGFKEIQKAVELDPMSLIFINNIAETYIDQGNLDAAYKECQRIIELDPNFWAVYQTLVWVRVKQGKYDDALVAAQKGVELSNRSNSSLTELGYVYGKLGRTNDAQAIIKELEERYATKTADGTDIAEVYAGLGDKDRAFEWLEKAFGYHSFELATLRISPLLDPLHSDPRWKDLAHRIGVME
ncbi:MAG: hypothetical protein DMF63_10235 [Acidobacteria bacterium]|nr:MAG: hypothetical protein DMF63_10235 [Acidobacteriota bacterium]